MKIVLSLDEVVDIIAEYLISNGKLENKPTDVHLYASDGSSKKSYIEFKQ